MPMQDVDPETFSARTSLGQVSKILPHISRRADRELLARNFGF